MLTSTHVAALLGLSRHEAQLVMTNFAPLHYYRKIRCSASELSEYCNHTHGKVPPLVIALMADEREYPRWLVDLADEWRVASVRLAKTRRRSSLLMAKAETWDEARDIAESMPDLEARGYLDDELPPETRMRDHWFVGGEEDGQSTT